MDAAVSIAEYRSGFKNDKKPDRKKIANEALDGYVRIQRKRGISHDDLTPILQAIKSRHSANWEMGTDLLFRLAVKHETAKDCIRSMMDSKKVLERFRIIAMLGYLWDSIRLPRPLMAELIRGALQGQGTRVREKAAEAADRLQLKELIPELVTTLRKERHRGTRESLQFHLAMLRDGYILVYRKGKPMLTVRCTDGWSDLPITQDDIDQGKLKSIIAEARSDE